MDLELNAKLDAIMKRNNTDVWNDDCRNDPEYRTLSLETTIKDKFDLYQAEKQASEYRSIRAYKRHKQSRGSVQIGSYKFRSKKN